MQKNKSVKKEEKTKTYETTIIGSKIQNTFFVIKRAGGEYRQIYDIFYKFCKENHIRMYIILLFFMQRYLISKGILKEEILKFKGLD